MLLPFTDNLVRTWAADPDCARLADRHYSRGRIGSLQFAPSGRKLILRDTAGLVAFVWLWPDLQYRADHQEGAGWQHIGYSKAGLHLLEKRLG